MEYMVECRINEVDESFISRIPYQRFMVNSLMAKGSIISYTLSSDRSRLWMVIKADDEISARKVLNDLPLTSYMEVELFELLFNNSIFLNEPVFSLN